MGTVSKYMYIVLVEIIRIQKYLFTYLTNENSSRKLIYTQKEKNIILIFKGTNHLKFKISFIFIDNIREHNSSSKYREKSRNCLNIRQ